MFKHGKNNTPLYHRWEGMIQRTTNMKDTNYSHYGARGIKVCTEWRNDFMAFYNWAMANGYQPNLSLDRINVYGNYEPSNCRWVDMKVQSNNKTNNIFVEYKGNKVTLSQLSQLTGIARTTLLGRYQKGDRGERLVRQPLSNKGRFTKERAQAITHPSKLTIKEVRDIKRMFVESNKSNKEIAIQYHVAPSTINDIRKGRTWKYVAINHDNTELTD